MMYCNSEETQAKAGTGSPGSDQGVIISIWKIRYYINPENFIFNV